MSAIDYAIIALMIAYAAGIIACLVIIVMMAFRWMICDPVRPLIIPLIAVYLFTGTCLGVAFKLPMNGMTWPGVLYFTFTWPIWQLQGITGYVVPAPRWAFT